MTFEEIIERRALEAKLEIKLLTAKAMDEISVRLGYARGYFNRSAAQRRRYERMKGRV